jgi:hypothetical protein
MKLEKLDCPACGSPLGENVKPNHQFDCPACGSALILTDLAADEQIVCPQCKRINLATEQFCQECGAALKMACPFCYAQNAANAEHCKQCGVSLQRARQRKQAWLDEQRRHEAERQAALKQAEAEGRHARMQQLLNDLDEPERHSMALYCLSQYGAEAVESLVALLKDDDPDARYGAAQALGSIGDPRAVGPLVKALNDPEPAVRYWASDALGRLRAEAAAEAIGNLLQDKHKGVRAHAAEVLEHLGGSKAQQVLQKKGKRGLWPF